MIILISYNLLGQIYIVMMKLLIMINYILSMIISNLFVWCISQKWHNRDKDYKDIIEIIEFSKSNIFNWELINKNLPKKNHLYFLRNFKIFFLKIKRKIKRFFLNRYLHKDCFQIIPTNILLSRQTNGINFLDMI